MHLLHTFKCSAMDDVATPVDRLFFHVSIPNHPIPSNSFTEVVTLIRPMGML